MRSIFTSSLHVFVALLALVQHPPLLTSAADPQMQVRLAIRYADIVKYQLDSVDKIIGNALAFLRKTRGNPKKHNRQVFEMMISALRSQIEPQLDQFVPHGSKSEGHNIEIYFPLEFMRELYGEDAFAEVVEDVEPEVQPPPSPPLHQDELGDNEEEQSQAVMDFPIAVTSPYATFIDHDDILRRVGLETTAFNDFVPSICDSRAEKVLSLVEELDLPSNFNRYNCAQLVHEFSYHRAKGRWTERAVLEEFFFALIEIPPEEEERWMADDLVVNGEWLGRKHICSWNGITCGSTIVGPGPRGLEKDGDDANCVIVGGVKTCKKTRCNGRMDVDELLGIPCPSKTSATKIDLTSIPRMSGTLIDNLHMLTDLHRLNLMKNNIRGTVPESFSELKKLEFLDVSENRMTSQLPRNLPSTLEEVWFENNSFTGQIPDDFERFKNLRFLDMSNNQFTGTIPAYFTEMTRLNSLVLAGNKLTGSIPDFNSEEMDVLDFSDNKLTGLPNILPPDLSELKLGSNKLSGPFPDSKMFETLTLLNMTGNDFTGKVPTNLDLEDSEEYLKVWKSFGCDKAMCQPGHDILCSPGYFSPFGAVSELGPCQICPLSEDELKKKQLGQTTCSSKDYIAGDVNGDGKLSEREILQLFYVFTNGHNWGNGFQKYWENINTETCGLPGVSCGSDGEVIAITPNNANLCAGDDCHGLPSELGLLKSLQIIGLSGASKLKGSLPSELGMLENLNVLKVDKGSSLTGTIPTEIGNLKSLKILDLSSSGLTGSLPSELGQLSELTTLNLSLNSFSGSIPSTITQLKSLKQLVLSRCTLSGRIPEDIRNLQQLENLELYGNRLTGSLPSNLMGMDSLKRLDVFANKLTSSLPAELGTLKNLQIIHVKENLFSGTIPVVIGYLPSLTWFDISNNNITGTIDRGFGSSTSLVDFRAGQNQIHGPIPTTLCSNKNINEGLTSKYGCDAILCPLGTFNEEGYATSKAECKPCPSGKSTLYLGANENKCVTITQREILAMFFDVMGGELWGEERRRGWKTLPNECEWSGISCDENGEINSLTFQMRQT